MCTSLKDGKAREKTDSEPFVSDLIFSAKFTAASKKKATLAKSSSINPLEVRAGVPEIEKNLIQ